MTDFEKQVAMLRRWRADPALFCREFLGWTPWARQAEVMRAIARRLNHGGGTVATGTGHGVGKTWMAAGLVLWGLACFPEGITVVTTAPTHRQVEEQLWRDVGAQYRNAHFPIGGHLLKTKLELAPNVFALGLSTDNATSFQGYHNKRVLAIVDEAAGVKPIIYGAIEGITTGAHDVVAMFGNTTSDGLGGEFHRCFTGERPAETFTVSSWEAARAGAPGLTSLRWCEDHEKMWGANDPEYLGRVLGQWPDASTFGLISYGDVQSALERDPAHDHLADPVIIGVDVARFGDDRTAWVVRQGNDIIAAYTARKQSLVETYKQTLNYALAHRASHIITDDTGLGGGLTDMLTDLDPKQHVTGINFGEASRFPEQYENRRAEIWFALRDWFKEGRGAICIEDRQMVMDLTRDCVTPTYKHSKTKQRRQLESKADMKKRTGGASPDLGDAMALCFAMDTWGEGFSVPRDADEAFDFWDIFGRGGTEDYV